MNTAVSASVVGNTHQPAMAAQGGRAPLFRRFGAALWRALEAVGRSRANREVLDFADRCEAQQPELARELRAACRQGVVA